MKLSLFRFFLNAKYLTLIRRELQNGNRYSFERLLAENCRYGIIIVARNQNRSVYFRFDIKPQYKLKRDERVKNLSNAFEVNKTYYTGKTVLLIDDICTTGSTFEEMTRELKRNGIDDIICFAATTPFEE